MTIKYLTTEWIAEQRQISEIVDMACEYAPGSVVPLLKQIEKSQTAALDALEAALTESEQWKRDYGSAIELLAEKHKRIDDLTAALGAMEACMHAAEKDIEALMLEEAERCHHNCHFCAKVSRECNTGFCGPKWRGLCSSNTDAPTGAESEGAE